MDRESVEHMIEKPDSGASVKPGNRALDAQRQFYFCFMGFALCFDESVQNCFPLLFTKFILYDIIIIINNFKEVIKINKIFCKNSGEGPAKGTVIIVHGFGEYAGSYIEFARRLAAANYSSVTFDQRGHGNLEDPRLRGIIPGYQCFLDDINSVYTQIKQESPDTPVVLYGHSMGGNIAANYMLAYPDSGLSCAVLESPWFGLYKEPSALIYALASVLGRISPNLAINSPLSKSDVTSDTAKTDEMEKDPLYHNRISFRMVAGIKKACKNAISNAPQISVPVYLAYAEHERIVSNQAIFNFYNNCIQNVTIKEYASCHAIHNDVAREGFYNDVISFIGAHCPI